jgi:protein AroM
MKKIGIVTIGQSPRPDVVKEMSPFFGENINILERGALDGLAIEQVKELSPERDMLPFCTRMSDGTEVIIAKEKIIPLIQQSIQELNENNVSIVLLLCVGSFPYFESNALILYPQRIVDRCVESLVDRTHHLGIVIPLPEQEDWARDNFSLITPQITITDISPYSDLSRLPHAIEELQDANCDLIVMYCMGFTREITKEVRRLTGKPVILSNSIVARTIGELLE